MASIDLRAAAAYRSTHVESRSKLELVVLLYDALVRHLTDARQAVAGRDLHAKRQAVTRSLEILTHLQTTLDHSSGGAIAAQLQALYTYVVGLIAAANMQGNPQPLDQAIAVLTPLREAWTAIATGEAARISA